MKTILLLLIAGVALVSACTVTPGIGIGLDLNYSGGKFHVTPTASIGIHGHP